MSVQFSSLPYLQNWKTRFVYFILMPLIDLCLLVLIDFQYTNNFNWSVAVSTVTLSGGTLAMDSMAQLFVMDRNLKIDKEMLVNHPFSFSYWFTKVCTSFLAGVALILINLLILEIFHVPLVLVVRSLLMTPIIVLSGIIVGFLCTIGAWKKNNPYFYMNIAGSLTTIVSGTLILVEHYPKWLRIISYIFPFSQTIKYIVTGKGAIILDLSIDFIWLFAGIICYFIQIHRVLKTSINLW